MESISSKSLVITLIFSFILNPLVSLSPALAQEYSVLVDNDNGAPPENLPFPPLPEVLPDMPENSLISHWSFDNVEGNVVNNEVENQPGLLKYGDARQIDDGKVGRAMFFDGANDSLENQMLWGELENFSVALWVRAYNLEGFQAVGEWSYPSPLAKASEMKTPGEFYFNTFDNGRGLYFGMMTGVETDGTLTAMRFDLYAEDANLQVGAWYHIAATYGENRMILYIDGDNVASRADVQGTIPPTSIPLMIGRDGRMPRWWNGAIDEVRIYDHALSPEEVLGLYGEAAVAVDNTPPSSSMLPFEGDAYWKELELGQGFQVNAVAIDDISSVENVELWYRYSLDNWTDDVAWKKRGWQLYPANASLQLSTQPLKDNFDGPTLDQKWENAHGTIRPDSTVDPAGSGEAVLLLENGELTIEARSLDGVFTNFAYSKDTYYYGTLEVRARAPNWGTYPDGEHRGVRFGFDGDPSYGWSAAVEIGAEWFGLKFITRYAGEQVRSEDLSSRFDPREYHTYRIEWLPGEARIYIDGERVATHTLGVPRGPLRATFWVQNDNRGIPPGKLVVDRVSVRPAYRAGWQFTPELYGYYEFFSVATDAAGNRENLPGWVQTTKEDFENGALENLDTETSPGDVRLAENVAYSDSFESYPHGSFPSDGGWEVAWGPSGQTFVVENVFGPSNKSFKVQGEQGAVIVRRPIPTDTDRLGYELWVNADGVEQRLGFLDDLFTQYAVLRFDADGWIYFDAYDGQPLQPYEQNRWYRVRVVLSKGAERAQVWVDGELKTEIGVVDGNRITAFFLNSGPLGGRLYVDDIELVGGYLPTGVFTSHVYDSGGAWTEWGEVSWSENCPDNTDITLQTRSGNTQTPDGTWSDWSKDYTNPTGEKIVSPPARFIQYRATLSTADPNLTPELREVRVTWPVAQANVRVAEDLVRVAVIPAIPRGYPPETRQDLENSIAFWRENGVPVLSSYYDEVSYGALAITTNMFTRNGGWFELPEGTGGYPEDDVGRKKFAEHAIDAALSAGVPLGSYQIVAVTTAYWELIAPAGGWAFQDIRGYPAFIVLAVSDNHAVTHEPGHVLGKAIGEEYLPDLAKVSPITTPWGEVDGFDLMGTRLVHLSSWSKERLGWLEYEVVDWVNNPAMSYWENWIDALPTLGYRGGVYRHQVDEDWWVEFDWGFYYKFKGTDYILEVRTENESYSRWDTGVPGSGLVPYQVATTEKYIFTGLGRILVENKTRVNIIERFPFTEDRQPDTTEGGVQFRVLERYPPRPVLQPRRMKISAQRATENQLWYIMRQAPFGLSENALLTGTSYMWPDLDLHAYTLDGRHIGVNYETGGYEIEIEGALASGDLNNGTEWIRLPAGVEAYFTISGRDMAEFLTANPEAKLEYENGVYAIGSRYHDERGEQHKSTPIGQVIEPGAEIFNQLELVRNPDGTYSVAVNDGKNLFDLATWQAEIDNMPDNIFIKNPAQRKNALKEKFEEVFEDLEEAEEELSENDVEETKECYLEAAEKLANDILKKLDGDGQADWVKEPALVDELEAFIGILRHRAGGSED